MYDLFDYLEWRGDLSFGNVTLSAVDTLVFSVLSYLRLEGIVPEDPKAEPVRLADAAKTYFEQNPDAKESNHHRFLRSLAGSVRFGQLRLVGAQKEFNAETGIQFSAYTALLPGQNLFVAFEGTDGTLVGWEEDFRMSYECPVPAQLRAVEYLRRVAAAYPLRRIFVGGHSKGGNLAMFAAVHAGPEVAYRIRGVYNHDGPGFCDGTLASVEYLEMRDRIHTYLPESSIVGVLLEHDENYRIVKSEARGLAQHDPYSWAVQGPDFVYTNERTAFGQQTEAIVDHFVNSFSPERKRMFGEALFTVLGASKQDTISGIMANKTQSIKSIVKSFASLDPEVRELLITTVSALGNSRKIVKKTARKGDKTALPDQVEQSS